MADPRPIAIKFAVRGMNDVLKAIRTISDAVNQTERHSTAAVQAQVSERTKARQKEAKAAATAAAETCQLIESAEKNGTTRLSSELKTRLQNITRHLNANFDAHQKSLDKINAANKKNSTDVQKTKEKEFAALKRETAKWEQETIASSRRVATIQRQIAAEKASAKREIMRGGTPADPRLSPQARLSALEGLEKKPVAQQQAALDKVRNMRLDAAASRQVNRDKLTAFNATEREKTASLEKAERDRARVQREYLVAHERSVRDLNQRKFDRAVKADQEVESRRLQFAKTVGSASVSAAKQTGAAAALVGAGLFSAATTLGGGFSLTGTLQDRLDLERQAALLSNEGMVPGAPGRVDQKKLLADVKTSSIRTNTDASDLMGGLRAYVARSADLQGGRENLDFFAKVAKATGSDIKSVMDTAGMMRVQNKDLDSGEMRKLILSTVMQARQGSVEFSDMARAGAKITKTAGMYEGSQAENQRKLLGLSQIGMKTSGTVEEAATSLSNLTNDATNHKKAVEALLGHKFKNDKGQFLGGADTFIGDLMEAAMKRPGGLDQLTNVGGDGKKLFGLRSVKIFEALAPTYNSAEAQALKEGKSKTEAQAAGAAAVRKEISEKIGTKYDEKDLEKDFATVMQTSAEQFSKAVLQMKTEMADRLVPEVVKLIPVLQRLADPLAKTVEAFTKIAIWASDNPFKGLAIAFSAFFLKEIAAANIPSLLSRLFSGGGGALGGGGAIPGVTPAGAVAAGESPGRGLAAGGLVTAGIATSVAAASYYADRLHGANAAGTDEGEALAVAASKGDKDAQAKIVAMRGNASTGRKVEAGADVARRALNLMSPLSVLTDLGADAIAHRFGKKSGLDRTEETVKADAAVTKFDELNASSDKLAKAMQKLAAATDAVAGSIHLPPGGGSGPPGSRGSGVP